MNKPTHKQLIDWWHSLPNVNYTCRECGRIDTYSYVQPQHPYYNNGIEGEALCYECTSKINKELDRKRKEALAAMPRCQVKGCKIRATLRAGSYNPVGMCRRHFNIANRKFQATSGGMFWLAYEIHGEEVLQLAAS